jgi:ferrous iron transport protein B
MAVTSTNSSLPVPPAPGDSGPVLNSKSVGTVVVFGLESAGKSTVVSGITGCRADSSNYRGTTVSCERYQAARGTLIDTPGILFSSETEAARLAVSSLDDGDAVLLVVRATHLDDELDRLLPIVAGRSGAVVVTFWDKVQPGEHALEALEQASRSAGVPFIPVDGRRMNGSVAERVFDAMSWRNTFRHETSRSRTGWKVEPRASLFERGHLGALLSLIALLLPAWLAVQFANTLAGAVDPLLTSVLTPATEWTRATCPVWISAVLAGRYGLLTMGPLLFVWAVPTVAIHALLSGVYKSTGWIDRLTKGVQPWMRPFGLTGRDLVRVLMGMGCNVPAVISSRSCSPCTRGTCLHAIGFGSACSYQFGATLGVFAASGKPWLIWPYLGYLAVTTLIYSRWVSPPKARSRFNLLLLEGRSFLQWPTISGVWREVSLVLREFFGKALPIFVAITLLAAALDLCGVLDRAAGVLTPVMSLLALPGEAALPVVLACIRKDGLLLFAEGNLAERLSSIQLLTGVYFAGVLVPCLVTVLTIAREQSIAFAARLLSRQLAAAMVFSLVLASAGRWLSN